MLYYNLKFPNHSVAPPGQQCAMGFLNEQSLEMIVSAPRDNYSSRSLSSVPGSLMAMSMPFTQQGLFRKIIIAAMFNPNASVGWPSLRVIRRASNGTPYVPFSTHMEEPKPTGYLNVYEYDVSTQKFIIKTEDVLNISWYGSPLQQNQTQDRFSLAYYSNATIPYPGIPMISVFVDTNVTMCHEEVGSTQSTKSAITTNSDRVIKRSTTIEVIVISGVVLCSLVLLSVLIISVICILVMRQRRKKLLIDSTGISRRDETQQFHETASTNNLNHYWLLIMYNNNGYCLGNERYPAIQNDYLSDDMVPASSHAQALAMVHDNPQDVRIECMLYIVYCITFEVLQ